MFAQQLSGQIAGDGSNIDFYILATCRFTSSKIIRWPVATNTVVQILGGVVVAKIASLLLAVDSSTSGLLDN